MSHEHQWREVERWHPSRDRTRGGMLAFDMDSVDEHGVGHAYKREPARKLVCDCGAERVEFMRDGRWLHSYTRTWD